MEVAVYYTTFDPDSPGFEIARDIRTYADPSEIESEAFATAYDEVLTADIDVPDTDTRDVVLQRIYERMQGGHVDQKLGYDGSDTRSMMQGDIIVLEERAWMVGSLFEFHDLGAHVDFKNEPTPSDQVVHLECLLGAEILVWASGNATICNWDDTTAAGSPAARDLAVAAGVEVL